MTAASFGSMRPRKPSNAPLPHAPGRIPRSAGLPVAMGRPHFGHRDAVGAVAARRLPAIPACARHSRFKPSASGRRRNRAAISAHPASAATALSQISQKSTLAETIRYAPTRRTALTRHRDDRRLEIDNSPVERSLRPVALGRKVFFFAGPGAGGEREGLAGTGRQRIKALEQEVREWRQANGILRKVSVYFARATFECPCEP